MYSRYDPQYERLCARWIAGGPYPPEDEAPSDDPKGKGKDVDYIDSGSPMSLDFPIGLASMSSMQSVAFPYAAAGINHSNHLNFYDSAMPGPSRICYDTSNYSSGPSGAGPGPAWFNTTPAHSSPYFNHAVTMDPIEASSTPPTSTSRYPQSSPELVLCYSSPSSRHHPYQRRV
ncbi:hypothetical protein FS749_008295 [Ceratobasidium sp. UAMH 11750]|nr:hypothetical protein FS749_008295 [Ceratobasidium sp. UAMH 11750]